MVTARLAIDTSGELISLACETQGRVCAGVGKVRLGHERELADLVTLLLQQARVSFSDLEGLIVAEGPGSFTGLRIGFSFAAGLSFGSTHVEVQSRSPFWAAAHHALWGEGAHSLAKDDAKKEKSTSGLKRVSVVADARRGELFCSRYEVRGARLQEGEGPFILTTEEVGRLEEAYHKGTHRLVFLGDNLPERLAHLSRQGKIISIASRAEMLLPDSVGSHLPDGEVAPLYVREVNARTIEERG